MNLKHVLGAAGAVCSLVVSQRAALAQPVAPAAAAPAAAASAAEPPADWDDRTMKGHTFLYPILQEGAFNTMHFGIRQGFAYASFPNVPLGSLGSVGLSASGVIENFDLGVKILPWLGVYGTAEGQVALGTNIDSLLLAGGNFSFSGNAGLVLRIARIESTGTELTARAFGGGGTGRDASIVGLVDALFSAGGKAAFGDVLNGNLGRFLLTPTGNNTFGGSVHAAQAIGKYFGAQAAVEGDSTRQSVSPFNPATNANVSQTTSIGTFKTTVGVDVDGAPGGVPLGAMAEYELEYDAASGAGTSASTLSHFVGVGLYYTARRNLVLGLGGKTQLNPPPLTTENARQQPVQSGSPTLLYGQFILRYVW
jgi:hypothetical protein